MSSIWHRSNLSIAARIGVLLLMIAALALSVRSTNMPEATPEEHSELRDQEPTVAVSASTNHARPGQTIGLRISATADSGTDIVVTANNVVVAEQSLPSSGILNLAYKVPDSGPVVFGVKLRDRINRRLIATRPAAELVNIAMAAKILVVSDRPSSYAKSLLGGGWPVVSMQPALLAVQSDALDDISMLVLDDVAVAELPLEIWQEIDNAVRVEGLGLLVLGGPNSFALGAYRESLLENLLPVLSEPPNYEPAVSLVFLVDVSGSMDRPGRFGNRLRIAKQAVVDTSMALRKIDHVGLMSFDIESREHLRLSSRENHADAVAQSWPSVASGGTRLRPAIASAIERLEDDVNTEDMLVVVTDGGASQDDLIALADVLAATETSIIALIISDASDRNADSLMSIFESSGATAVRIDKLLQLPSLMRSTVEKSRPALVVGPVKISAYTPTSWLPAMTAVLEVDKYLLTRPREEATVHLRSPRGDVVMASIGMGAGEVIAVTSGFSEWAGNWMRSDDWPSFAANLARRLSTRDKGDLEISVINQSTNSATLIVDGAERESMRPISATLVSPNGASTNLHLSPSAPGQLSTGLPLPDNGEYVVRLDDGLSSLQYSFIASNGGDNESAHVAPVLDKPMQLWSLRLIYLGLILFLGVLVWERR